MLQESLTGPGEPWAVRDLGDPEGEVGLVGAGSS